MNIHITNEDVEAVEEEMSMDKEAWDLVDHKELVRACVVVFFRKTIRETTKALEAQK